MKKILLIILFLVLLTSPLAACNKEGSGQSSDTPEISAASNLPSSVDLRNYNGKNYVTPVKTQLFGDCWAFSIAAASEISYLYANDLGVPAGEENNNVNFSEKYLSWYVYNGITKEDVTIGKVPASQVGEGYDLSELVKEDADAVFFFGGQGYAGENCFASGFLPVDENASVNGEYVYAYSGKYSKTVDGELQYVASDDWSIPLGTEYRNPPSDAFYRGSAQLPSPAGKDAEENYVFNKEGVDAIKSEISKGHGVTFGIKASENINTANWAIYNIKGKPNHAVTVVGYDDNYPKENFTKATQKYSTPPENGAFIVKDTRGENYANNGYLYVSYYDRTIQDPVCYYIDKADSVTYKNTNYDQYDLLLSGLCCNSDYEDEVKMANVFEACEDEFLFAIEYRTIKPDTSVHYEIYKNPESGSPSSGTLLEEGNSLHPWGGYHKLELKNEYELKKGEKYSVILTLTYKTEDGTSLYTSLIPFGYNMDISFAYDWNKPISVNTVVNEGESLFFTNGKWSDLLEHRDEFAETAYFQTNEKDILEHAKPRSTEDISIDNFPIKALLVPKSEH